MSSQPTKHGLRIGRSDAASFWCVLGPAQSRPYSGIDQYEFDVPVGQNGDVYDRYLVRMAEIHESVKIVPQVLDSMPSVIIGLTT